MLASELIRDLTERVRLHGDVEVMIEDPYEGSLALWSLDEVVADSGGTVRLYMGTNLTPDEDDGD